MATATPSLSIKLGFFEPRLTEVRLESTNGSGYGVYETKLEIPKTLKTGGFTMIEKIEVELLENTFGARTQGVFTVTKTGDSAAHVIPPTVLVRSGLPTDSHQMYPYSESGGALDWAAGTLGAAVDHKLCDASNIRRTMIGCLAKTSSMNTLIDKLEESLLKIKTGPVQPVAIKCLGCKAVGDARVIDIEGVPFIKIPVHTPGAGCRFRGTTSALVVELNDSQTEHPLKYMAAFIRGLSVEMIPQVSAMAMELQNECYVDLKLREHGVKIIEVSAFPMVLQGIRREASRDFDTLISLDLLEKLVDYQCLIAAMGNYIIDPLATDSMSLRIYSVINKVDPGRRLDFSVKTTLTIRQFPYRTYDKMVESLKTHRNYTERLDKMDSVKNLSFGNLMRLCDL